MRVQLAGWCVLLAVAGSCAADKPKKGKQKPTTPPETGAVVGPLGGGLVGPLVGKHADRDDTKFVVTKPVGTWVRDVQMRDGAVRVRLTVQDDRLTLKVEMAGGVNGCIVTEPGCAELTADYSINKESCLYGLVDTFGTDQPVTGEAAKVLRLSGQPFSVRFRSDDKTLSLKDFKGFGVGTGADSADGVGELLLAVCGQYTAVDPKKPLPPLKATKGKDTDPTPLLTPSRIHGGILKADPPKEDVLSSRLDRVPYPTPHYLKHYPTYIPPEPAMSLRVERDAMLDPTGEIRRGGPGKPPASVAKPVCDPVPRQDELLNQSEGPVTPRLLRKLYDGLGRVLFGSTPQRIHGGILKADPPKEEPNDSKTRILPPLKKGEQSACEAPTDAELMRVFNERRQQEVGRDFELAQDDIVIVKNLVKDKISPPRFYPLVGFAQLHSSTWECGVYFNVTTDGKRKPKVEVIQIDKDHLHMYVGANADTQREALLEMTKWR